MKKALAAATLASLICGNALGAYIVVLRNGTVYKAKSKWTLSNGKAMVTLETGQVMQLDPSLIDEQKSEQATRLGTTAQQLARPEQGATAPETKEQTPSLGATFKLRKAAPESPAAPPVSAPAPAATSAPLLQAPGGSGMLSPEVIDKFARAYENVGLFEQNLKAIGPTSLHAELTADTEDKVFNAISATSFLLVRNAGVTGARIDMVELFMKTTTGGSAGRFQMTRADAEALDGKKISQQEYFVRRVIY